MVRVSFLFYNNSIMNKFKNVVNSNSTDKIAETIELLDGQWNTIEMINNRADLLATKTRASFMSSKDMGDNNTYNGDTLSLIYNLQLPSYMSWDYYVAINQWTQYWVNRCEIECEDDKVKAQFKLALGLIRQWGQVAVVKKDNNVIIGTLIDPVYKDGEIAGGKLLPTLYATSYNWLCANPQTHKIELKDSKDKDKLIDVTSENTIFGVCRFNGVGDYVWCMKDILIDIYLKTMIQSNASNLQDKMWIEVNNPDTLAVELWLARNPFKTYGIKINDAQSGAGANNFKFSESKGGEHSYINTLIETLKHHQEYYYSKYGRPITSNKAQSLSSDSSLSISSAEAIANDWDERVENFANAWNKLFGTNITIKKPELNTPPQNENADKEGLGQALTEGDTMLEQAKEGK